MPLKQSPPPVFQLKVKLQEIEPPIWWRIQVPGTMLLCRLHDALKDGKNWGIVQLYEDEKFDVIDDGSVTIGEVLKSEAFQGEHFLLPVIGGIAQQQARK